MRKTKKKHLVSNSERSKSVNFQTHGLYGYFITRAGKASNLLQLMELIEEGIKLKEIKPMMSYLEFELDTMAKLLEVSPRTVQRWEGDTLIGKLAGKHVIDLDRLINRGVEVFGSEESFKDWLNQRNIALGDQRPIKLLAQPYGIELVEDAVDALDYGQVM